MAQIIENQAGRRMIRLSPDDVLTVVSHYQQQLYGVAQRDYEGVRSRLKQELLYLPEEV
jgi:hypothetical protein